MSVNLDTQRDQIFAQLQTMGDARLARKRTHHRAAKLDDEDIKALMGRTSLDGPMTRDEARKLNWLRVHYADHMAHHTAFALDKFLSTWVATAIRNQLQEAKDKEREKKAEAQIEKIEKHHDELRQMREDADKLMREWGIDGRLRFMVTEVFNRG